MVSRPVLACAGRTDEYMDMLLTCIGPVLDFSIRGHDNFLSRLTGKHAAAPYVSAVMLFFSREHGEQTRVCSGKLGFEHAEWLQHRASLSSAYAGPRMFGEECRVVFFQPQISDCM